MSEPLNRREFLSAGSTAAAGVVVAAAVHEPAAHAAGSAAQEPVPLAAQRKMTLQMSRAGMVFPLKIPAGELAGATRAARSLSRLRSAQHGLGPGLLQLGTAARPSLDRLRAAERAMPAAELTAARDGAGLLVRAGLLDAGVAALLDGVGRLAATTAPANRAALACAATLSVRTVFAGAEHHRIVQAASHWLSLLGAMHEQDTLRPAIRQRGLR